MYVLLLAVLKLDNYIRISVRSADECADKEVGPKGRRERDGSEGSVEDVIAARSEENRFQLFRRELPFLRACSTGCISETQTSILFTYTGSGWMYVVFLLCSRWIICSRSVSGWSSRGEWIRGRTTPGQWRNARAAPVRTEEVGCRPHLPPSLKCKRGREGRFNERAIDRRRKAQGKTCLTEPQRRPRRRTRGRRRKRERRHFSSFIGRGRSRRRRIEQDRISPT